MPSSGDRQLDFGTVPARMNPGGRRWAGRPHLDERLVPALRCIREWDPLPSQLIWLTGTVRVARASRGPTITRRASGSRPHDIERLSTADPDAAALSDRVVDDPVMRADNPAIQVHDIPRF